MKKEAKMHDFLCPKCREHLRVGENIIFKVKNSKKQSALLLLSAHIGNYTSHKHRTFELQTGESLDIIVRYVTPLLFLISIRILPMLYCWMIQGKVITYIFLR